MTKPKNPQIGGLFEDWLKEEGIHAEVTTPSVKRALQEAAVARNKTVTEFILDVALTEAAELRANQRLFVLDDAQWQAFIAALDAPAKPRPRLEALLREPGVFD